MTQVETRSLKERIEAFAAETAEERERLETQRRELGGERDAEVAAIQERHMRAMRAEVEEARERWRERLRELDETLATARRLYRALNPPAPKPKPQRQPRTPSRPGAARPSDRVMREVLKVIGDGADISSLIQERVSFSRGSVGNALPHLRGEGLIRLTGERMSPNGRTPAKTYVITEAGIEYLRTNETASNGAHA